MPPRQGIPSSSMEFLWRMMKFPRGKPVRDDDISRRCLARIFGFYSQVYKSIRVAGESSRRIESLERAQSYLYLSFTTVS